MTMFGPIKKRSRLGQWNGRRRSSRSDEPVMPHLGQKQVLLRFLAVLLTTVIATFLAFLWGRPLPYRVGETCPRDLRARVHFEVINQPQTDLAREEAVKKLHQENRDDAAACEEARAAIPPVMEVYPKGTPLVERGQTITTQQYALLEQEHRAFRESQTFGGHFRHGTALFLIMLLLAALVVLYVIRFQHALAESLPKIGGVCALAAMTLALGLLLSRPPWYAVLIPLTVTALILTITYNPQFALLMSLSLSLATTVALGNDLNQ